MIKEYRNSEGFKITEQQVIHMDGNYQIYNYEPTTLFLQEIINYEKDEIFQVKYFKKDSENENDIINYLSTKNFFFLITSKEVFGSFIVCTVKSVNTKKGGLLGIEKEVYEISDTECKYLICGQGCDKQTLQPILGSTLKFIYSFDDYGNGEKVQGVKFTYKTNGELNLAVDMTPDYNNHKNWDEYTLANFQELQDLFPWDISYYKNANLLP